MVAPKSDGRSSRALPRLDWYPGDYLADRRTRTMTLAQHGAYHLLMWFEWLDGPLPNDHAELAALLGISDSEFCSVWERVGPCFKVARGKLISPRLERERRRALDAKKQASSAGRKGAAARWGGHSDPNGDPNAVATDSPMRFDGPSPSPSPSPSDTPQPPKGGKRKKPTPGPQDQAARDLAEALGASLNPCRKQVSALVKSGWSLEQIRAAFSLAVPGMAPWDWTKAATQGPQTGQNRSDDLMRLAAKYDQEGR